MAAVISPTPCGNRRVQALPRDQRGVASVEFALVFLLGMLPLLMLTFSGVLILAARQSLTLAAEEGARAALRYGSDATRATQACQAARQSMQWLLTYSGEAVDCAAPPAAGGSYAPITVSAATPCASAPSISCMTVITAYDYNAHPFIPGTTTIYGWLMQGALTSSATVQLDTQGN
ncbi:TadE/TadG family type IV pilus assembly protein [Dyella sp. KULCS107]|uniref:TadE/TadG family type IV pilus assembly protein n=1 Tax=unclassified Dyella TaxID=2634549 RepID=UPI003D6F1B87